MNYTWGRLRTSTSCLRFLVAIFPGSWLSPHFSPFLMFPWKCAERFFKSETLLIIWSSTTVTAQQLAVGECWAGLGLGCWVELETKVREGFIVTLKDPTRAFTFRSASKICLDAMFRWPFSLLPCEECSTRASSGHCENFADLCFQLYCWVKTSWGEPRAGSGLMKHGVARVGSDRIVTAPRASNWWYLISFLCTHCTTTTIVCWVRHY